MTSFLTENVRKTSVFGRKMGEFLRKWLLLKLYFIENPELGFELNWNPMQAHVVMKHSTLPCLGSAIYSSPSAVHTRSEELLVQSSLICIYLQFYPERHLKVNKPEMHFCKQLQIDKPFCQHQDPSSTSGVVLFCVAEIRNKIASSQYNNIHPSLWHRSLLWS